MFQEYFSRNHLKNVSRCSKSLPRIRLGINVIIFLLLLQIFLVDLFQKISLRNMSKGPTKNTENDIFTHSSKNSSNCFSSLHYTDFSISSSKIFFQVSLQEFSQEWLLRFFMNIAKEWFLGRTHSYIPRFQSKFFSRNSTKHSYRFSRTRRTSRRNK